MQERGPERPSLRIAFVHPDLGLGGAERLIVDAALSLKQLGHKPKIYTGFQDANRTFEEVAPPKREIGVEIIRTPFPRAILGRLQAVLAGLRCAWIALYVCLFCGCDVAVVDIVSMPVLVFAMFGVPTLFYCHYPDKLLGEGIVRGRRTWVGRMYRMVVDGCEGVGVRWADGVVCNSRFTARAFEQVFGGGRRPGVVYPCVGNVGGMDGRKKGGNVRMLVSLNRFERKKGVGLAVEMLDVVRREVGGEGIEVRLVIAGGYDVRVRENVEYFRELERLVERRGLTGCVEFRRNIGEEERLELICGAVAVIYTPENEHFGIVPLEAMAAGTAVVAVNSGGPIESVVDGECGRLCEASARGFADAVLPLVRDVEMAEEMGRQGRERVRRYFSRQVLGREMQNVLIRLVNR